MRTAAAYLIATSFVLYRPVYATIAGATLSKAPWFDVALQAVVQGVLTAIVARFCFMAAWSPFLVRQLALPSWP
jgi:hypothetical protein